MFDEKDRRYKSVVDWPVGPEDVHARIRVEVPMTEAEWDEVERYLKLSVAHLREWTTKETMFGVGVPGVKE